MKAGQVSALIWARNFVEKISCKNFLAFELAQNKFDKYFQTSKNCVTKQNWLPPEYVKIVFVWSQNDGGNVEQKTIGYGCRQTKKPN